MKKAALLRAAAQIEPLDATAASDLRAVAQFSTSDETREVLALAECHRFHTEARYDIAGLLWEAINPELVALYRAVYGKD